MKKFLRFHVLSVVILMVFTGCIITELYAADKTCLGPFQLDKKGFIHDWLLCGPFPNNECSGWDTDYLKPDGGEKNITPQEGMSYSVIFSTAGKEWWRNTEDLRLKPQWQPVSSKILEFSIKDVESCSPSDYVITYAACYIESPQEREIKICLGSDDGTKVYLNHKFVGGVHIHRGIVHDNDVYRVNLKKGYNLLLLKVEQGEEQYEFCLRLKTLNDQPLEGVNIFLAPKNTESAGDMYDKYGGWTKVRGKQKTKYFHVEQLDGKYWLVDPDGYAFLSKGVGHVIWAGDSSRSLGYSPYEKNIKAKYGAAFKELWVKTTLNRLKSFGFNSLGAWSCEEIKAQNVPFANVIGFAAADGASWLEGTFTDVFSEHFLETADKVAKERCKSLADNPYLIGYFTDNELKWNNPWFDISKSLLDFYLTLPEEAAGKKELVNFLKLRYTGITGLNNSWGTNFAGFDDILKIKALNKEKKFIGNIEKDSKSFLSRVAVQYFKVCSEAIKRYDPNHLNLGCRFCFQAPDEVVEAMKDYVDAVSYNYYDWSPCAALARKMYEITGKPIILTEFSFKANDSGLPNTKGAGKPVDSQEDRAAYYDYFVTTLIKQPYMIGYHWFQYIDQPEGGREGDGENSNYGVVDVNDEPWKLLTQKMTEINANAEVLHTGVVLR